MLSAFNNAFPSEKFGDKFFTIWYGVYQRSTATLRWSGGGIPMRCCSSRPEPNRSRLDSQGPAIGMMDWPEFDQCERPLPPGSRLYVYSDGVHEIHKPDGTDWEFDEFVAFLGQPAPAAGSVMDALYDHVRALHGSNILDDDFSILEAASERRPARAVDRAVGLHPSGWNSSGAGRPPRRFGNRRRSKQSKGSERCSTTRRNA